MRLIIFGSTGKTGLQFVSQALERGHSVTAFVRDPAKLTLSHDNLQVVQGDIQDAASIDKALDGSYDAVISALGIFHKDPRSELSAGTRNLLDAMEARGPDRLAVVSSLGAGDSKGQGSLLARGLQRFLLNEVLVDKTRQEEMIQSSSLRWTIARPPQLTDDETVRTDLFEWQGGEPRGVKLTWKVSRASVAGFLLDAVEKGTHIREIVNISEPK
jgi:putative NADH-flavin reductase